jgi:2-polyprenyl-6-methoxyphenol hydroxylase-like FAD-dependent oxidoreductase
VKGRGATPHSSAAGLDLWPSGCSLTSSRSCSSIHTTPLHANPTSQYAITWAATNSGVVKLEGFSDGLLNTLFAILVILLVALTGARGNLVGVIYVMVGGTVALQWAHAGMLYALADLAHVRTPVCSRFSPSATRWTLGQHPNRCGAMLPGRPDAPFARGPRAAGVADAARSSARIRLHAGQHQRRRDPRRHSGAPRPGLGAGRRRHAPDEARLAASRACRSLRSASRRLRIDRIVEVLITGGGIAGLAAGIALERAGHKVQVLERAQVAAEVGAGLAIWPNGRRALDALGVHELPGIAVRRLQLLDWRGRPLREIPVGELKDRYGHDLLLIHRRELHDSLFQLLGHAVRFGADVTGFEQDSSRVCVALRSGERIAADLLVGADGIRSAVRAGLLGDGDPRYSGATCWRGVTSFGLEDGRAFNWWGRGGEFGIFPLDHGRAYWFAVQNRPHGQSDVPSGRKADVAEAFASWPEMISAVVAATDENEILRNDLYDRPPVRNWSLGRVTLIGDAAHPLLASAAQGACQALEDAVALADGLTSGSVEDGLRAYQSERIRAANAVVSQARQAARMVQSTNSIVSSARDLLVAHLPKAVLLRQLDSVMRPRTASRSDPTARQRAPHD